ncbi:MAG: flagellar brake protein [Methylocystaceae bacterium]
MIPDDLKINQLVEVAIGDKNYHSRVEGIDHNDIQIGIPLSNGALLPVYNGDEIRVSYTVKKEYDQLISYSFTSRVQGRDKNPVPVMLLELPHHVDKAQRRKFLRIPVNLPCQWLVPEMEDEYNATVIDVSGGGCRLKIHQPIDVGTIINLKLNLPDKPALLLTCQTVRVLVREDKSETFYHCGFEFIQIRENHRDIIIKYLLDIQRDNIKKRRI